MGVVQLIGSIYKSNLQQTMHVAWSHHI